MISFTNLRRFNGRLAIALMIWFVDGDGVVDGVVDGVWRQNS